MTPPWRVGRRMSGDYVPTPGRAPAQEDTLFGEPAKIPTPRRPAAPRPTTQAMDLIESVIATARHPGYVLVGPTERVYRRDAARDGHIERVPDYEDAAVHQLLGQRLLTLGGTQHVRYGRREGRAHSVLVPRTTARTGDRWRTYRRVRQREETRRDPN